MDTKVKFKIGTETTGEDIKIYKEQIPGFSPDINKGKNISKSKDISHNNINKEALGIKLLQQGCQSYSAVCTL